MIKFNSIKTISLKTAFIGLVLFVNLLLLVTILFFTYEGSKNTTLKTTEILMEEVTSTALGKLKTYFETSYKSIKTVELLIKSYDFDVDKDPNRFFNLLTKTLRVNPLLTGAYLGREDGSFFMAKRMPDFSISYRIISRTSDSIITTWKHKNLKYQKEFPNLVQSLDEGYDPRVRSWYIKAKKLNKIIWSKPYIFASDKLPGISIAVPIDEKKIKGVIALDFGLNEINNFINTLKINELGSIFLINDDEKVFSYSDPNSIKVNKFYKEVKNQNGDINIKMLEFSDINNEKLQKIYKYAKGKKDTEVNSLYKNSIFISILNYYIDFFVTKDSKTFTDVVIANNNNNNSKSIFLNQKIDGEKYLAMIKHFKIANSLSFKLGIIFPQTAAVGYFKYIYQIIVIIIIVMILISIVLLIYIINREISSPIMLLSNKMVRMVRNFELEKGNDFSSANLREITHMREAFESVRKAMVSFAKYLPKKVVRDIVAKGEVAKVGGENREITIFFSDIQDFAKISEDNSSDVLLVKLKEYFNMIESVISSHKGILDKYIGDAVMAMWGAPHKINNPAAYACMAAVEIINKIKVMNKKFESEEFSKFITRIGINTDHVVVGNIGSKDRINYTCLGDGVNLASRLEELNKFYKTQILVSNKTLLQAKDYVESRLIGRATVKVKSQKILIHEVVAKKGDLYGDDKIFLKTYKEAIRFYLDGNWDDAVESFTNALKIRPKDFVTKLYLEKSKEYSLNPPKEGSQDSQLLQKEV